MTLTETMAHLIVLRREVRGMYYDDVSATQQARLRHAEASLSDALRSLTAVLEEDESARREAAAP
jgi:hypothetical protein